MQISTGKLSLAAGFLCLCLSQSLESVAAVKDQSRISPRQDAKSPNDKNNKLVPDQLLDDRPENATPLGTPNTPAPSGDGKSDHQEDEAIPANRYEIDNIPALTQIKLTVDLAKRALDAFEEVGRKYDDKGLNDYPTLEEFVEKTEAGKQLEADVKKHGFKNITAWNRAIMNVSFSYGALNENQEKDIRHQIEDVKKNQSLSEEKRRRIIASLNALIQPKENIDIIREIQKLPAYADKLNLLNAFE